MFFRIENLENLQNFWTNKKLEMGNYLPGLFASPHPIPQETTPNESATSFTMQEIDPPESPWNKNLDRLKIAIMRRL